MSCLSKTKSTYHTCIECGTIQQHEIYYDNVEEVLIKYSLCFKCNFWREKVNIKDRLVIVDGKAYYPTPDTDAPNHCKGFGGAIFRYQFLDGRIETCGNMWSNGVIPQHFRDRLPDNAKFLRWNTQTITRRVE